MENWESWVRRSNSQDENNEIVGQMGRCIQESKCFCPSMGRPLPTNHARLVFEPPLPHDCDYFVGSASQPVYMALQPCFEFVTSIMLSSARRPPLCTALPKSSLHGHPYDDVIGVPQTEQQEENDDKLDVPTANVGESSDSRNTITVATKRRGCGHLTSVACQMTDVQPTHCGNVLCARCGGDDDLRCGTVVTGNCGKPGCTRCVGWRKGLWRVNP